MITFIITLIIVGLIAGFIARAVVPGRDAMSIPATIALGIVGSFLGGFLLWAITGAKRNAGLSPAGIIGSIVGAILALLIYNFVMSRSRGGTNRI